MTLWLPAAEEDPMGQTTVWANVESDRGRWGDIRA
jgi:hypothetical protein